MRDISIMSQKPEARSQKPEARSQKCIIICNCILLLLVVIFCWKYNTVHKIFYHIMGKGGIIDPVHTDYYRMKTNIFESMPTDSHEIVFLGDSITEYTNFNELFHMNMKNRGIGGDDSKGILKRAQEAVKSKPVKIFLLLGINDIGNARKLDEFIINYREILRVIHETSPDTEIYIQSILPVNHKMMVKNPRNRRRTAENILLFNKELLKLAKELNHQFLDIYLVFSVNNELIEEYTWDGVHLNGKGMAVWGRYLEQYL